MPSALHEIVLSLCRAPGTLTTILRDAFDIDAGSELTEAATSFSELSPASYVADLVLVGEVVLVVEVQLRRDDRKRFSWPLYVASAHLAHQKPTYLVVVALDPSVAAWARAPIASFHGGLTPIVVGREQIPKVTSEQLARTMPELAVLSVMAWGDDDDGSMALAGLAAATAAGQNDEDRGTLYLDAVLASLNDLARTLVEARMRIQGYEYQSDFARRYFAQGEAKGEARGKIEGEAKGKIEGKAEGKIEGKIEGKAEGKIESVRALCEAFDIPWTEARADQVAALDHDALRDLLAHLAREHRWPDER